LKNTVFFFAGNKLGIFKDAHEKTSFSGQARRWNEEKTFKVEGRGSM